MGKEKVFIDLVLKGTSLSPLNLKGFEISCVVVTPLSDI